MKWTGRIIDGIGMVLAVCVGAVAIHMTVGAIKSGIDAYVTVERLDREVAELRDQMGRSLDRDTTLADTQLKTLDALEGLTYCVRMMNERTVIQPFQVPPTCPMPFTWPTNEIFTLPWISATNYISTNWVSAPTNIVLLDAYSVATNALRVSDGSN